MKKRLIMISALVLALVLALFALTACNNASSEIGAELVENGSFNKYTVSDSKVTFDNWTSNSDKYNMTTLSDSDDERLQINHSSAQYTAVKQTIKVDRNCVYKLSLDMLVTSSKLSDDGAYVVFMENTDTILVQKKAKTDGFEHVEIYVRPKNAEYLTLALCLGTEKQGVSGSVYFDNISMTRVNASEVPSDQKIIDFKKAKSVATASSDSGIAFVVLLTLLTVAIIVAAYLLLRRMYARRDLFSNIGDGAPVKSAKSSAPAVKWYKSGWFIAAMLALGAALIRLIPLLTMYGMGSEMTALIDNAKALGAKGGVVGFFAKNANSTLAPGQMYILAIIGAISTNSAGTAINYTVASTLIRLVNILADMAVVLMIYFYGKKYVGNKLSTLYAALYAVLPVIFLMSGVNGTFASLLVALLLGAVILMVEKQYLPTYLVMTLAAVLDMRALAIAPIVVAYFGYRYYKDEVSLRKFTANRAMIVFGLVGSFVLAYVLTLPIAINQIGDGDAFFNFKMMIQQITGTTYFVSNAFNLYGMVAMNGKVIAQKGVTILNLLFLLVLEAYVISLYFKNRNKQELILLVSFTLAIISVFTLKVDYTYLFLSIAFALVYTMVSGDKRMYLIVGGYSLLGFLDIGQLLNQSNLIASNTSKINLMSYESTNPFYIVFCVLTVLLTAYYVYVCYSITNNTKIVDIKAMQDPVHVTFKRACKNLFSSLKKNKDE
ncbi:MAG: hypothetical protein K2G31_04285 [Clostridia bacterium]|nr:hypothetical protein [Clostridia bacterium]